MTPDPLSKLRENKPIHLRAMGASAWMKSRVEAVLGKYLHVAHPAREGRLLSFSVKQDLEIGFAAGEEYYTFLTKVLDIRRKPVPLLVLERPEESELIGVKRRLSPRVDSLIPMTYELQGGAGLSSAHHTLALNLSASGLAFNSVQPISAGSRLRFEIHLPTSTAGVSASGDVVACAEARNSRSGRYKIRVRFTQVTSLTKSKIADFVREKRRNRLEIE